MPSIEKPVLSSSLPTLHLDLLLAADLNERRKLLNACRSHGFFYLDLSSDLQMMGYWEQMLETMKDYFEQPLEVKMEDARGSDNTGYEPMGTEVGPFGMTRDGYESLKVSRREHLQGHAELTTSIRDKTPFIFDFMRKSHEITMMMCERLSDEMGLSGSDRFESFHSTESPTLTNLAWLRYPKYDSISPDTVGHNKHTDIGSLTLLFAKQWGLQILSPDAKTWAFVKPRPGHAVVNVGDSLHFPSGRRLASVVHRVIPVADKQMEDRYSIAYFLRVHDLTPWVDSTGKEWTAKEWHDFKFDAFRSPDTKENGEQVLTGMMEDGDILRRPCWGTEEA
ncbi:unnamed protein product [Periconia digitata]|uniref:Fe2OG dioxygenase domain-containing protein n=1 Tax=Periconia digitata TaxID=1303443 RepID=A0A9W4UPU8_9PLEO|nr:unnamed protein product [Periconia digitata]